MYPQFQRFIATILLCSILLQSCGGVELEVGEEKSLVTSDKKHKPRKPPKLDFPESVQKREYSTAGAMVPKAACPSEVGVRHQPIYLVAP
jgi:hypothetical protein